jgi:hypothetical protein
MRQAAHEIGIAARIAGRALRRRLQQEPRADGHNGDLRAEIEPWLARLPREWLISRQYLHLPATTPPWTDTGMDLSAGDTVTWFAGGRVHLSRPLDLWTDAAFGLWARIGLEGPIFRSTRETFTFGAEKPGRLWLTSHPPGEWTDRRGQYRSDPGLYRGLSGGLDVALVRWHGSSETVQDRLRLAGTASSVPRPVRREVYRIESHVPPPDGWQYLWNLGPAEIYREALRRDGKRTIACHTHGDAGILQCDARIALEPGTRLSWSWMLEELPIDLAEDTVPSHDYMSIAVEFDDGQDITYYWSSQLPVGTTYRCPLPAWHDRETHVVVRSGSADLGHWLDETRDVQADYVRLIGGSARTIRRVWLIANSLFQRGHGRSEYGAIRLGNASAQLEVL